MNKVLFILCFIILLMGLRVAIQNNSRDQQFTVCRHLCERSGRELASITQGFVVKCNCGKRKMIKQNSPP